MVWKVRSPVDERMLLIGEYLKGERGMADLCQDFGVSRKTAYKWVARYNMDGPAGLADKSRAPLTHPARLEPVVVEALLEARRAHPHWGARKVLAWLVRKYPDFDSPAASTVSAIFAKYGLSAYLDYSGDAKRAGALYRLSRAHRESVTGPSRSPTKGVDDSKLSLPSTKPAMVAELRQALGSSPDAHASACVAAERHVEAPVAIHLELKCCLTAAFLNAEQ